MKKLFTILILFLSLKSFSQSQTNGSIFQYNGDAFGWSPYSTVVNSLNSITLIASKTSVAGNTLASTALDFASGISLATHTPIFSVIVFRSGTTGISVLRIKTDAGYLVGVTAMLTLTSTDNNFPILLTGAVRSTGSISVEVTTAGLAASLIDVYVFGIKKQ